MKTSPLVKNDENIKIRENIVPFGIKDKISKGFKDANEITFTLYTTEKEVVDGGDSTGGVYQIPTNIASGLTGSIDYLKTEEVSVKITNIPLQLTSKDFYELMREHCGDLFIITKLVYDHEKECYRGYGYVRCLGKEKARELAKIVRGIVIGAMKLNAEVIE